MRAADQLLVVRADPHAAASLAPEEEDPGTSAGNLPADLQDAVPREPAMLGAVGFRPDRAAGKIANLLALVRRFCSDAIATGTPRRILVFNDNDEIMARVI